MSFYKTNISPSFPDHSKVWIYQAADVFTDEIAAAIQTKITEFTKQWSAHKLQVNATGAVLHNLFVVLVADESEVNVSGCSIDSSVHFIKALGQEFNIDFFDRMKIAFRSSLEGEIEVQNFNLLIEKINSGAINSDINVFNNTIQTLADFKTKWLVPVSNSWLGARINKEALSS